MLTRILEADRWYRHWLSASTDPRDLRSRELRNLAVIRGTGTGWESIWDRQKNVQRVCDRRAELLKSTDLSTEIPSRKPAGKLLLYCPDLNLACGAAEAATDGFFDGDNVPPCDFWVSYVIQREPKSGFDSYLICWIPEALTILVEAGIDANPEGCITWSSTKMTEDMDKLF